MSSESAIFSEFMESQRRNEFKNNFWRHVYMCQSSRGNVRHYKRRMRLSAKAKRHLGA